MCLELVIKDKVVMNGIHHIQCYSKEFKQIHRHNAKIICKPGILKSSIILSSPLIAVIYFNH